MTFGYPDIFKYPAVQYIPLQMYHDIITDVTLNSTKPYFSYFTAGESQELYKILQSWNISTDFNIGKQQIALLFTNSKIDIIMYRGYEVLMVGEIEPDTVQLFKITTSYFYKDHLVLTFYNKENSQKVSQKNLKMSEL